MKLDYHPPAFEWMVYLTSASAFLKPLRNSWQASIATSSLLASSSTPNRAERFFNPFAPPALAFSQRTVACFRLVTPSDAICSLTETEKFPYLASASANAERIASALSGENSKV